MRVIVMLTAESEGAQIKCHPYWGSADYGPLHTQLVAERAVPLDDEDILHKDRPPVGLPHGAAGVDEQPQCLIVRHLTLSHSAKPFEPVREITQLQYSHWPDFLAPASQSHLVRLVEACNRVSRHHQPPAESESGAPEPEGRRKVLVHCSAGCGRTGTFCTVDSVIDMLKRQRRAREGHQHPPSTSTTTTTTTTTAAKEEEGGGGEPGWWLDDVTDLVASTVEDFRTQRPNMVQSLRQFGLCYETVLEWLAQEKDKEKENQKQQEQEEQQI